EAIEKGGPGRRKQPRGGKVVRLPIGYDEIDRMFVVEMIDLEPICERGQVPFEKIDEDALARLEHGAKRAVRMRACRGIDNQQQERPRCRGEALQLKTLAALRQTTIGGCQSPARSPKQISPAKSARMVSGVQPVTS